MHRLSIMSSVSHPSVGFNLDSVLILLRGRIHREAGANVEVSDPLWHEEEWLYLDPWVSLALVGCRWAMCVKIRFSAAADVISRHCGMF